MVYNSFTDSSPVFTNVVFVTMFLWAFMVIYNIMVVFHFPETKHNHDIVYYDECPEEHCNENYIGENGRRISERIIDHAGGDSKSYIYKNCIETGHRSPDINDFKIIGSNFHKNVSKRKIAEALLIKQLKPTLKKQEKLIDLKLFNRHHVYACFSV